jgi:Ca2+-binding EF-hand superfamily protein
MIKHAPNLGDWNEHFAFIDTGKQGFITFPEFKAAALNRQYLLSNENLDAVFSVFDKT